MTTSIMSGSNSGIISELLFTGRRFNLSTEYTKYVCHTSTIPLATTVDTQVLLDDWADSVEVTHSIAFQPGYDVGSDYRCCKKHCMFVRRDGSSDKELLRANCPCGKIIRTEFGAGGQEVEVYLQPLCFIQVLKELRKNFAVSDTYRCETDDECCHNENGKTKGHRRRPSINLDEVMFCQDSDSITDSSYSKPLRAAVGFSGWEQANTAEKISAVLDQLYWYRRFSSNSTRNFLAAQCTRLGPIPFRRVLEQCLHTLNGALIKKFLCFPCEMEGYRKLAELTAGLFGELIRDYLKLPQAKPASEENSVYLYMKWTANQTKVSFGSDLREVRLSPLGLFLGKEKPNAWDRFWGHAFNRLRRRIEGMDGDYTESPAYIHTMSGFSQTRVMGHLPSWVADQKRAQFRDTISRPRVEPPLADLSLIAKLVIRQASRAGIEPRFLTVSASPATVDFKEVLTFLEIPLKPTASVTSTVSMGGKVEDARLLFSDACANEWKIPIRDFHTGKPTEWICFNPALKQEAPGYQGHLFWLALQLLVNSHHQHDSRLYADEYIRLKNSETWMETMYKMHIVHISEPGKERNLTKTSAPLAWVLTVASKISQMVLSFAQDHRAGLVLSAQDWMHQRRVSGQSFESEWIYEQKTRRRKPDVWNGYQDWTQSTDFIPRRVGATAVRAWYSYIAFPEWFAKLTLWSSQRDYNVTEVTGFSNESGVNEPIIYKGIVSEGWMMSMPLTKTVLHLMHDVNIGLVESIMEKYKLKLAPRPTRALVDCETDRKGPFYLSPEA